MCELLYPLINYIISKYFLSTYCLVIISEYNDQIFDTPSIHIPTLYFTNNENSTNTLNDFILNSLNIGCSDYIVNLEEPEMFIKYFEENIHLTNQRRGNRKLIFLPLENVVKSREKLENLLNLNVVEFIPDILIILPDINNENNCTSYDLATQKYVGKLNNTAIHILDTWDCEKLQLKLETNLFPDKLVNLQGRIMKVATFKYKPYVILEFDQYNEVVAYDGTEMRTAIEFCRWSNCELEIIRDDEHEWGEIWDNRTGNGIIGNIVMDKADFGFGALYSWYHEYQFLDLSMPVVRTGITCIAPAPQLLASYLLPVLPFNKLMWGCVLASIIYASAGLYISGKVQKRPPTIINSLLRVVGIVVLQNPSEKHPSTAMKHVINLLFFFSLMLSNAYSSGLASTITVPIYEEPIDTVHQLVKSNLDWGATHDAWIFSILEAVEPQMVHLVKNFKKWSYKKLKSKGKTRDFAFSVERLPAGHFAIGEYVTNESVSFLQLMTQDIYFEYCVLMARKSSPFTKRLNMLLGRLHQSGLLHAWESQVVLKYCDYTVQLGVRLSQGRQKNTEPRSLNLRQLAGPLFLWGLGVLLSVVVLIIEVVSGLKKKKIKKQIK